jgi:hypothetical protein
VRRRLSVVSCGVTVAVDDLPLAALAAIDVGNADGDLLHRATRDRHVVMFEADGVCKIAAYLGDVDVEAEAAAVREAGCELTEEAA